MAPILTSIRSAASTLSSITKHRSLAASACRSFSKRPDSHHESVIADESVTTNERDACHHHSGSPEWRVPGATTQVTVKLQEQDVRARARISDGSKQWFLKKSGHGGDTREHKMILDWSIQPTIGPESFDSPLRSTARPIPATLPRDVFSLHSRPNLRYGQPEPSLATRSRSLDSVPSNTIHDDNHRILVESIRDKTQTPNSEHYNYNPSHVFNRSSNLNYATKMETVTPTSWTGVNEPLFFERSSSFGDSSSPVNFDLPRDRGSALSYLQGLTNKKSAEATRQSSEREFLYSPKVVLAALQADFRIPYKLYYSSSYSHVLTACLVEAKRAGVRSIEADQMQLDKLSGIKDHEGVVLETTRIYQKPILMLGRIKDHGAYEITLGGGRTRDMSRTVTNLNKQRKGPLWVVLDGFESSRMLGSIIQTSYDVGVDGLIMNQQSNIELSASVSRASNGALEKARVYCISNLARFTKISQRNGWHVIGMQASYKSNTVHKSPNANDVSTGRATVLVISQTTREHGDRTLKSWNSC